MFSGERLFITFTVLSLLGYFFTFPLSILFLIVQILYDVGYIVVLSTSNNIPEESNLVIIGNIFFSLKIVFNLSMAYFLYNYEYVLLFLYVLQFYISYINLLNNASGQSSEIRFGYTFEESILSISNISRTIKDMTSFNTSVLNFNLRVPINITSNDKSDNTSNIEDEINKKDDRSNKRQNPKIDKNDMKDYIQFLLVLPSPSSEDDRWIICPILPEVGNNIDLFNCRLQFKHNTFDLYDKVISKLNGKYEKYKYLFENGVLNVNKFGIVPLTPEDFNKYYNGISFSYTDDNGNGKEEKSKIIKRDSQAPTLSLNSKLDYISKVTYDQLSEESKNNLIEIHIKNNSFDINKFLWSPISKYLRYDYIYYNFMEPITG